MLGHQRVLAAKPRGQKAFPGRAAPPADSSPRPSPGLDGGPGTCMDNNSGEETAMEYQTPSSEQDDFLILDLSSSAAKATSDSTATAADQHERYQGNEYFDDGGGDTDAPLDLTVCRGQRPPQGCARGRYDEEIRAPEAHKGQSDVTFLFAATPQNMPFLPANYAAPQPRAAHTARPETSQSPGSKASHGLHTEQLLGGNRVQQNVVSHPSKIPGNRSDPTTAGDVDAQTAARLGHVHRVSAQAVVQGHVYDVSKAGGGVHADRGGQQQRGEQQCVSFPVLSSSSPSILRHHLDNAESVSAAGPMQLPTVTSLEFIPDLSKDGGHPGGERGVYSVQMKMPTSSEASMLSAALPATSASAILLDPASGGLVAASGGLVSAVNIPLMTTTTGGLVAIPFLHALPETLAAPAQAPAASTPSRQASPPNPAPPSSAPPMTFPNPAPTSTASSKSIRPKLGRPRGQGKAQKQPPKDMKLVTENTLFPGVYTSILKLPWSKRARGKSSKIKNAAASQPPTSTAAAVAACTASANCVESYSAAQANPEGTTDKSSRVEDPVFPEQTHDRKMDTSQAGLVSSGAQTNPPQATISAAAVAKPEPMDIAEAELGLEIGSSYHASLVQATPTEQHAADAALYQEMLLSSRSLVEVKPRRRQLNDLIKPSDDCVYTSFRITPRQGGRGGKTVSRALARKRAAQLERAAAARALMDGEKTVSRALERRRAAQMDRDPGGGVLMDGNGMGVVSHLDGGGGDYSVKGVSGEFDEKGVCFVDKRGGSAQGGPGVGQGSAVITERIPGAGDLPLARLYQELYHCKLCNEMLPADDTVEHNCGASVSPSLRSCDACGTMYSVADPALEHSGQALLCQRCVTERSPPQRGMLHHPSPSPPPSSASRDSDQTATDAFACLPCGVKFVAIADYIDHRRSAHLDKLSRQPRKTHTLKTQVCPAQACPRLFHTQAELACHVREEHQHDMTESEREQALSVCGIKQEPVEEGGVPDPGDPQQDPDELSGAEDPKPQYTCTQDGCTKTFQQPIDLLEHVQASHEGVTEWQCPMNACTRVFAAERHLRVHLLMHKDEKPLKCKFCNYRCRQKNALNWHMRKHPESANHYRKFPGLSADA
ncbi:hypothetical protein BaRGS_00011983 [Batillaria attramentaria]|uniref:C2H2-type domain-containing protein n=1 Tax=Batillaria attramentaria TaxID=370345 RepID=A0ABD0LBI8_9CAEN